MEKGVATIYRKIRINDEIYMYDLVTIVEDAIYNDDYTITCTLNGQKTTLYAMEDINFTISDEEYCYNNFIDLREVEISRGISRKEAYRIYQDEVKNYLNIGILDLEREKLKIISHEFSDIKDIEDIEELSAKYHLMFNSDSSVAVILQLDAVKAVMKLLQKKETEKVLEFFQNIIDVSEKRRESTAELQKHLLTLLGLAGMAKQIEQDETDVIDEELQIQDQLDSLIGLSNVKKEVGRLNSYLTFQNKVKDQTNLEKPNLNMAFYGNPGTGKTTVARIIANILFDLGYAKNDKFGELTAKDFIAGYVGQTALKARKVLDQYKGGVIFIDEAYVFNANAQAYADEALAEILKEMEKKNTIFIFAGYKEEMKDFIDMNPGLKSRIGYHIDFKDYTLDELYEIFKLKLNNSGLHMDANLEDRVKSIISHFIYSEKFGNGRFIDNLIQKIIMHHADRLKDVTDIEILTTLESMDADDDIIKELEQENKIRKIGIIG